MRINPYELGENEEKCLPNFGLGFNLLCIFSKHGFPSDAFDQFPENPRNNPNPGKHALAKHPPAPSHRQSTVFPHRPSIELIILGSPPVCNGAMQCGAAPTTGLNGLSGGPGSPRGVTFSC
jgi:hypothetical protein